MTILENEKIQNNSFTKHNYFDDASQLHIISVVYSPFGHAKRTQLAQEFIHRLEKTTESHPCMLYIIEIIFPPQQFCLQVQNKSNHLKISMPESCILWNKENLINVGVRYFLPKNWKYMAWIDADIEFKNPNWVEDTLHTFYTQKADILQLFSFCRFLGPHNIPSVYWISSLYQYVHKQMGYQTKYFWQSGFAWACTHSAYDRMHGLFDYAIVGAGDHIMKNCFLNMSLSSFHDYRNIPGLMKKIIEFRTRVSNFKCWFVHGVIVHFYHGPKQNRMYDTRISILEKHNYDPTIHLIQILPLYLYCPSEQMSENFLSDIQNYFRTRHESNE